MKTKGIFIALEGTDGSGKKTQKDLLVARARREEYRVQEISFPQYGKPSAWQIEQYLNGFFGKPDTVNPYFASILYADDRRETKLLIERWLKDYDMVISDRYTASNAGHQGGKITDPRKRRIYLEWLWKTEFAVNQIPVPNINIILWVPPRISYQLVFKKEKRGYLKKGGRRDGHERDLAHLTRAASSYRWLAKQDPKRFRILNCLKSGRLAAPEEIHEKIWAMVLPLLPRSKKLGA